MMQAVLLKEVIQEYSERNKQQKDYPVYSVTNSQGFCKDYFGKEVASKDKSTYKVVPYGYFAYNPSRINVGSIDWQHCEEKVIVSPLYNIFGVDTKRLLQQYLQYYFKSRTVSLYINTLAKGTVRMNLSLKSLGDFPIRLPSVDVQESIVAELDLLSDIFRKQKTQISELDKLALSVFYDMFGNPVENEKGWEKRTLSDVVDSSCSLSYGIVQPGEDVIDGIPIVRPVDLVGTYVRRKGLKRTTNTISDSYKRTILQGNELLLCVRGTTGALALSSEELKGCNTTRGIIPIRFGKEVERLFGYMLFNTLEVQHIIAEHTYGSTLKQINVQDVKALPVIVPPQSQQKAFSMLIESIERQKNMIEQSILDTQNLFDYTMDKYFG